MRFVYPINVPESAKPGDDLNAKLAGVFKTTGTAVLQEDGSILVEGENLLSDEDKKRGSSQLFYSFDFVFGKHFA